MTAATLLGFQMEDALHGVQFFCTVVTVAFFATGSLTCLRIKRERSVRDVNFLPLLLTALNCILWTSYGYFAKDWVVVCVNFSGMTMQFIYIAVYMTYLNDTTAKAICYKKIIAALIFYLVVCFVVYLSSPGISKQLFGVTCDIVTIFMFASPLSTMGEVLKSKSTITMSFLQSLMMFIVSSAWLFYGYLIDDLYIKVPNGLGALLGGIQLGLFAIFPSVDRTGGKKSMPMH